MNHRIYRNSIYSLLGWLLPVVVNFLTIPFIVRMLGHDSYGVLTLMSAVIGYFSLMDINLTAGSIRYIAGYHSKGEKNRVNEVLSLSLLVYTGIGILGTLLLYLFTDLFLMDLLKTPQNLKAITRTIFHLASIGFFLNLIQNYLSSVPQSIHRFDISARIEAAFGICLTILTVVLLYMGFELLGVVVLCLVMLLLNCIILLMVIKNIIPYTRFNFSISRETISEVLSFSAYSFLSRIASAIRGNTDSLVIGTFIRSTAVTLYTVPFMLVNRLMNISYRLSLVLFPVASELGALGKHADLRKIYIGMNRHIFFKCNADNYSLPFFHSDT